MIVSTLATKVEIIVPQIMAMSNGLLLEGEGMAFLDKLISWGSAGVCAMGAGIGISGIMDFSEGKSQQNAAKKDEGMSKLIGGALIIAVGVLLVPQIKTLFPTS